MSKKEKSDKAGVCYQPKASFRAFLDKRLQILREQNRLQSERPMRGESLEKWEKEQAENTHKKRISDKEKIRYLNDVVFPSMANVICFLEAIAKNPELQKDFDNDLKDLVGFRYEQRLKHKGFVPPLRRFFDGLLAWKYYTDKNNFRFELIHWFQYWLFMKIHSISVSELGDIGNSVVAADMARALAWTKLFSRSVPEEDNEPSRPVKF